MNRAFSVFEIKSVDEDLRILEGIATTPSTDRVGDIVEPLGAQFTLPMPFLWQHGKEQPFGKIPIGHVVAADQTAEGIKIRVQLAKDDEPGMLQDNLNLAWRAIKTGLVRGISVGFKPIDAEPIRGTFGMRYKKWDWYETSAVTVPAHAKASISVIKEYDAASGDLDKPRPRSGSVKINPNKGKTMKPAIADRIKEFEATRAAKVAERDAVQQKSLDEGRTKDASEREQFETITAEIESIDAELKDLRVLEKEALSTARTVETATTTKAATETRAVTDRIVVTEKALPQGNRFARFVRCKAVSEMQHRSIADVAKMLYPDDNVIQKAAVVAGSTLSGNWAEDLTSAEGAVFADFVEFLRPQTIIGRLNLRRVPFRVPLGSQTSGGSAQWVGQGKAKPLTKFGFGRTTLEPTKVAAICVVTEELLRDSSTSAETLLRDSLAAAVIERLDIDFIDPGKSADSVSPASITNAVSVIGSAGDTADDVRTDIRGLFAGFIAANNAPTSGVFIMPATTALALSLMTNALGEPEFDGITMSGGNLKGMPVITSQYVDADIVVLANTQDIWLADEGGVTVDMSREASLEMDDAPSHDSITPSDSQLVSLWQTNSVGFRAERTINWAKRRAEAVQVLGSVTWGGALVS